MTIDFKYLNHYFKGFKLFFFDARVQHVYLPNCNYKIVVTKLSLPNCRYQVGITKLSLPNCRYQVGITKLSLPNCPYQIDVTKNPPVVRMSIVHFTCRY